MRARLVPLYFDPGRDGGFDRQVEALRGLLSGTAELLPPAALGAPIPDADAVVFPQLLGEAYRRLPDFHRIDRPILLATSESGTISMWDWEIAAYLRAEGVRTFAPYALSQTKAVCRALALRRELRSARFVVYQDNPGEGEQAAIFKRFYWWEEECARRMRDAFGVEIVRRSWRDLAGRARAIPDGEAERAWRERPMPVEEGVQGRPLMAAVKLYLAVRRDLSGDPAVRAVGINCLNESRFSDTTPCLAWTRLFEETGLLWGCEADTLSMLTMVLLRGTLDVPVMMTNLYPFLLGDAALRHERIAKFPDVAEAPEDHVLAVHCGYLGVVPRAAATEWTLRRKVLSIVDDNATAADGRLPLGPVTLAKVGPTLRGLSVAEGLLEGYSRVPGSHCLNGGLIRVRDGRRLMDRICSHHYVIAPGHGTAETEMVARVFGLAPEDLGGGKGDIS